MAFLVWETELRPRSCSGAAGFFIEAAVAPSYLGGWSVKIRPGHGRQYCGRVTIKGNPKLVSVGLCKWAFVPE